MIVQAPAGLLLQCQVSAGGAVSIIRASAGQLKLMKGG